MFRINPLTLKAFSVKLVLMLEILVLLLESRESNLLLVPSNLIFNQHSPLNSHYNCKYIFPHEGNVFEHNDCWAFIVNNQKRYQLYN